MSIIKKNFEYLKKEIYDIIKVIKDGENFLTILDSYEEYSKNMLEFIKNKDKQWFEFFFGMIECEIKKNVSYEQLKEEISEINKSGKHLISKMIDYIYYGDENIEEEDVNNNEKDNEEENKEENKEINFVKIQEAIQNFKWRENQILAINNTITQKFVSGVHCQIMGAGKTYIILRTIWEHFKLNNNKKMYIITCFRQEILKDLFFDDDGNIDENKREFLKTNNIIDLDAFKIINRVHEKNKKIKVSKSKPTILIVNTDYFKSIDKDDNIDYKNINFVIFDECHSVSADEFYKVLEKIKYEYKISIIGFSATPLREGADKKLINIFSQTFEKNDKNKKLNIISNYDFISAIKDNVILPPYYILCEVNKTLNGKIGKSNKDITKKVLCDILEIAHYKKVIGWCKSKKHLKEYYKFIKENFPNLTLYCSSSFDKDLEKAGYNTKWSEFLNEDKNAILLCINRGREGSDIKNLDVAIYLDVVKKRSLLVALQTSGRVLRKDKLGKKTHGLIIDTFVNVDGIQIEQMTAKRIINYYKQIFALCDENDYKEQKESYNKMVEICNNIEYDEKKQLITVKLDKEDEKCNMKFKLELKTKSYDFNKMKVQLNTIIDKMYNVDKKQKFDIIIGKIKENFSLETLDFWKEYDKIKNKDKMGIPNTSEELYNEYKEIFDSRNWYDILGLDTNCWLNFSDFKKFMLSSMYYDKYQKDIDKYYSQVFKKINKKMPINPCELYRIKTIYNNLSQKN